MAARLARQDTAEAGDSFGSSFNADGRDDLAVALTTEDFSGLLDPGFGISLVTGNFSGRLPR